MDLITAKKVKFNPTSLTFDPTTSVDEWLEIGKQLKAVESGIQWWLADWLNFGELAYGEISSQVLNSTDYNSVGSLYNLKYVASKIEPSRRHEELSFTAHAEVASLEPEQQDKLLLEAEEKGMTVKEIRSAVKATKAQGSPKESVMEVKIETTWEMLESVCEWIKNGIDLSWEYLGYTVVSRIDGIVIAQLYFKPRGKEDDFRDVKKQLS